ncbi:MAG: hypothetical protein FJ137_19320 [Deltaproteobacteria bacterium]|nr:hypothetical protein [Deltaproteobacteria bacterium]
MRRFATHAFEYAALLGCMAFIVPTSAGAAGALDVLKVAVLGGLWAGGMVSLVDRGIHPLRHAGARIGLAAFVGSLLYFLLFGAVLFMRPMEVEPPVLVAVAALGALTYAMRAVAAGRRLEEERAEAAAALAAADDDEDNEYDEHDEAETVKTDSTPGAVAPEPVRRR